MLAISRNILRSSPLNQHIAVWNKVPTPREMVERLKTINNRNIDFTPTPPRPARGKIFFTAEFRQQQTGKNALAYSDALSDMLRGTSRETSRRVLRRHDETPTPSRGNPNVISLSTAMPKPPSCSMPTPAAPSFVTITPEDIATPYDEFIASAEKIHQSLLKAVNILSQFSEDNGTAHYLKTVVSS